MACGMYAQPSDLLTLEEPRMAFGTILVFQLQTENLWEQIKSKQMSIVKYYHLKHRFKLYSGFLHVTILILLLS